MFLVAVMLPSRMLSSSMMSIETMDLVGAIASWEMSEVGEDASVVLVGSSPSKRNGYVWERVMEVECEQL